MIALSLALLLATLLTACSGPTKPEELPRDAFDPKARVESVQYADLEGDGAREAVAVSSLPYVGGPDLQPVPGQSYYSVSLWRFRQEDRAWEGLGGWEDKDTVYARVSAILARLLPGNAQQVVVSATRSTPPDTLDVVVMGLAEGKVRRYLTLANLPKGEATVQADTLVIRQTAPGPSATPQERRYRWNGRALATG